MAKGFTFKSTKELKIPKKLVDQIIAQEQAVSIIKKAAKQKRHVLLIGTPGTGKSLISQALAQLLPSEKLKDILSFHNAEDDNNPIIKTIAAGKGKTLQGRYRVKAAGSFKNQNILFFIILIIAVISPWYIRNTYGDIMGAAALIGSMIFFAAFILFMNLGKRMRTLNTGVAVPKLLVNNLKIKTAPFVDGSGAPATALLGNCLHDPLQSFYPEIEIYDSVEHEVSISKKVNHLLQKHKNKIIKKGTYRATHLEKGQSIVLAETEDKSKLVNVISVNKYKSDKPHLYKVTTKLGKSLTITPEHKVAINNKGKKEYIRADQLKKGQEVFTLKNSQKKS